MEQRGAAGGSGGVGVALRKGWWLIALSTVVAATVVHLAARSQDEVYQSTVRLVVAPAEVDDTGTVLDASAGLERRSIVVTLAEVVDASRIHEAVGSDPALDDLDVGATTTRAVALPESDVVELAVRAPDPEAARLVSSATARLGSAYFIDLYPIYRVDQVEAASLPTSPVAPNPGRDTALAAFGGLLVGVAVSMLVWGRVEEPTSLAGSRADGDPDDAPAPLDEGAAAVEEEELVLDLTEELGIPFRLPDEPVVRRRNGVTLEP